MKADFKNFSLEYLCQVIDILDPTIDDYLFVYNYQKDFFYIAPHAVQRFAIEDNAFYNATKSLEKLVYPWISKCCMRICWGLCRQSAVFKT